VSERRREVALVALVALMAIVGVVIVVVVAVVVVIVVAGEVAIAAGAPRPFVRLAVKACSKV